MEYSNTKRLNHNEQQEQSQLQTRLNYFVGSGTPTTTNEPAAAATLGSQRCINTPPTTPSSPLREPPQSPSDGHISSLSSHSASSDILLEFFLSENAPSICHSLRSGILKASITFLMCL
ncbi:maker716 [Drosophila busckii]|uniref:Maker716 n=1 Tax=Drosophila busckii TaxID=30019 RepID=A0A0M5J0Q3_DROBS|nr:uncharacterized protein LOC108600444 [Drosophila busckii]ALC44186.1 maker716 [Drosophila busckii]